jgi:hypothetical protein
MDCGSQTLLPCQCSHPPLTSFPLPSTWPTPLLGLRKCHPRDCLLSLGLWSHRAMPGMPPMPARALLCLAQGCLANQLSILYGHWPKPGMPPLGTHLGDTTLSFSLSLSLSLLSLFPPCSSSQSSFLPPRVRARKSLQLTLSRWQLDDSALLAWVT